MSAKPLIRLSDHLSQGELFGGKIERAQQRADLIGKLHLEGERKLAGKLESCGLSFFLRCRECHARHECQTKCCRKWCPSCAADLAAKRSRKLASSIRRFKWPLFVTLTIQNVTDWDGDFDFVRHLRRSFGKLRHRKIWKSNVAGGAAAIEVTNTGNGWHPHLHAIIDCKWLAVKTPEPYRRESAASVRAKCRAAAEEFTELWRKCCKQVRPPSVKMSRCDHTIAKEVMKYSIKPADLIETEEPIGPVLRMMDKTRLVTTFGSVFGIGEDDELGKREFLCPNGHKSWMPEAGLQRMLLEAHDRERGTRKKAAAAENRKAYSQLDRDLARYGAAMAACRK
jgi:hypothetical protein